MMIVNSVCNLMQHPKETATRAVQSCYNGIRHPLDTAAYAAQSAKRAYECLPHGVKVAGMATAMLGVSAYAFSTVCSLSQPPFIKESYTYETSYLLEYAGMEEKFGYPPFSFSGGEVADKDDDRTLSFLDRQKCDPTSCGLYPSSIMHMTRIPDPSPLISMVQQLQQAFPQTAIAILAPMLAFAAATVHHKFTQAVIPLQELSKTSTWEKAFYGACYLPAIMLAGWMCQLTGVSADTLDINVVSGIYRQAAEVPMLSALLQTQQLLSGAAFEEFLYRAILQGFLCTALPYVLLQTAFSSEKAEAIVHHKISKLCRVLFSALLFSAMHLQSANIYPSEPLKMQLFNTLGLGLACASLREHMGNAWGAVGLHAAFNGMLLAGKAIDWLTDNH